MSTLRLNKLKKKAAPNLSQKPKKKVDRFDGLTEEDLQACKLPDILDENLDMVFVGINPSLTAAYCGRYYAGPGNHFYKLLHESGLTPRLFKHDEDSKLLEYGIGLTNIVERPSRSSSDLKTSEIKEGAKKVEEKLVAYKPKIAIFNGKGIYEVFSNKIGKSDFRFGLQPVRIGNTAIWVVPSSSARCAHFPRMVDKLHFYSALKKYVLHVNGQLSEAVDETEFSFDGKCRIFDPTTSKMWRRKETSAFMHGGRVANKETLLNSSNTSAASDVNSPTLKQAGRETEEMVKETEIKCEIAELEDDKEKQDDSERDCEKDLIKEEVENPVKEKRMERKHTVDFVNLIKQRLSQEDNFDEAEDTEASSENCQFVTKNKPSKKLKYDMLKKNLTRRSFNINKRQKYSSDPDT